MAMLFDRQYSIICLRITPATPHCAQIWRNNFIVDLKKYIARSGLDYIVIDNHIPRPS